MASKTLKQLKLAFVQESVRQEVLALSEILYNVSDGMLRYYDDVHVDTYGEDHEITWLLRRINKLMDREHVNNT